MRPANFAYTLRRWLPLSMALLLLTTLLTAPTPAAARIEWGARSAWALAKRLLPGKLEGDFVSGALTQGVELRNVVYRDASQVIKVDHLSVDWHVSVSPLGLQIRSLTMDTVEVTSLPTPKKEATLPQELKLPVTLDIDQARIGKLVLRQQGASSPSVYQDIRLHGSSDGVHHQLVLEHAATPYGVANATLKLTGTQPFPLEGKAFLDSRFQGDRYRLDAQLSGSLRALGIQLGVAGDKLNGDASIEATPFSPVPFKRAQVNVQHLDPQAFSQGAPHADLDVRATLSPVSGKGGKDLSSLAVAGPVEIRNAIPGGLDQNLLPLVAARTDVTLDKQTQRLANLVVNLPGDAVLRGSGTLNADAKGRRAGSFVLRANALDMHAIHATLRHTSLSGPLQVQLAGDEQHVTLALGGPQYTIQADADLTPQQIAVHNAQLKADKALLQISGTLQRGGQGTYAVQGKLSNFEPGVFLASPPVVAIKTDSLPAIDAHINTEFQAHGSLQPELSANVTFDVHDSTYSGLPMTGGGTLHVVGKRVLPSDVQLTVAGNELVLKGSFGQPSDRLNVHVDAPALARLGIGLSGLLEVDGEVGGSVQKPVVDLTYNAQQLAYGDYRAAKLEGRLQAQGLPGSAPNAPISLALNGSGVQGSGFSLKQVDANVDGTYADHRLRLSTTGTVQGEALDLTLGAQGQLHEQQQKLAWDGVVRTLETRGLLRASLDAPMPLSVAPARVKVGATQLTIEQAPVTLKGFTYADGVLSSAGAFQRLDVGHLLDVRRELTGNKAPVNTTLVLNGRWDFRLADSASGFIDIERTAGDVLLTGAAGETGLGLNELALHADLQGQVVKLSGQLAAARLGQLKGDGQIVLQPVDGRLTLAPDAAVSGHVVAAVPRLQTVASLAGPSIALDGSLAADLRIDGTLADPKLTGSINGDQLAVTSFDQGVHLRDGTLRIALHDNLAEIRQFEFHGGEGTLRASGSIPLGPQAPDLNAEIIADDLQLLAKPGQKMTVSGKATAARVNDQLRVTGGFKVDHALFNLPEKSAPKLGDDVVIVRNGKQVAAPPPGPRAASPWSPYVNIQFDLGKDFRFEGSGAALRLAGQLDIKSQPGEQPQAYGTVRVEEGTYEAFGAKLDIERGVINFEGPFTNPNVNILAMRRKQEVAAGVQVTGTVQRPRVELVSEPSVPDPEKLSWLVFGRSSTAGNESGQAQSAAKGAALGLLNKFGAAPVAKRVGLDEFSIGSSESGLANQQVVNLGKEISDRLYVGYEQSLVGAESVIKLTYELSRNWSLVLRGGSITGLDALYSKRFDHLRGK